MHIRVKATQEKHGTVYGTLTGLELSEEEFVFALLLDAPGNAPDKYWVTIEQPTLSDVLEEAAQQGLSDIQPG